jgi:hypothetical protein
VREWRRIAPDDSDSYRPGYLAIQALGPDAAESVWRVERTLAAQRGRWISFSFDRLRKFGYRFDTY